MIEPQTRDLIFELGETGQPKLCIGVCDNSGIRAQVETTVTSALRDAGTDVQAIFLSSGDVDLVELLRRRKNGKKNAVFVVHGLGNMGTRALLEFLGNLNFRRDLLFELVSPILVWVTSRVLPVMVARAPDFWSRRTATYYFTQATVRELLVRLFGKKGVPSASIDAVSAGVQKILVTEGELNKLIRGPSRGTPPEVKHLVLVIKEGLETLLGECRQGRKFQVALTLWTLTRIDEELYKTVRQVPRRAAAPYASLYEDRNEILLGISERITDLLERYRRRVDASVERSRHVSLLGMFFGAANRLIQHWWEKREAHEGRFVPEMFSTEEIWEPGDVWDAGKHHGAGFERDWEVAKRQAAVSVEPRDMEEQFSARAAEEIRAWLEGESDHLPKVFSEEEGQLLRVMYEGSFDPTHVARKIGRPVPEVKRLIEALKGKVHAFLGAHQ